MLETERRLGICAVRLGALLVEHREAGDAPPNEIKPNYLSLFFCLPSAFGVVVVKVRTHCTTP
jgi:hypothetical protein